MSNPKTGDKSRHDSNGKHEIICSGCGVTFRTNNIRTLYHSYKCKSDAQNRRFYKQHRRYIINRVMLTQLRKRLAGHSQAQRRTPKSSNTIEEMSPEELILFIQNHPDQVRSKR